MFKRGDLIPHISVRQLDGIEFTYSDIWQRRNLLLVSLPSVTADIDREAADAYAGALMSQRDAFDEYETVAVVTRDTVTDLPSPAVVIADRWGEVVAVETARDVAGLPAVSNIVESLRFVAHACPECEGEAG